MEIQGKLFKATLILPFTKEGKVIFGMKTADSKLGANCWNGYGGGIEEGEEIKKSGQREFNEESTATLEEADLEYVALIHFHNTKEDGTTYICKLWVFLLKDEKWKGVITQTKEMLTPTEFDKNNLPFEDMMLADRDWMPYVMQGKKIIGVAYYGPNQKTLLKPTEVQEVDILEL